MNRREFLIRAAEAGMAFGMSSVAGSQSIRIFLCGDVMTGRAIDQILPHPAPPQLYESYIRDARGYVELAERVNGAVPMPVDFTYIWGDALQELERMSCDVRLINLETSITTSPDYWPSKGIHYRMNPANIGCLSAAAIDGCVLSNNHVLDWGYAGLAETLDTLDAVNISTAGAGRDLSAAAAPCLFEVAGKGRVLVFGIGSPTSGIPGRWAATRTRPGVNLLKQLSEKSASDIAAQVKALKKPGDVVVISIHWGGNWGYRITPAERAFAHRLIDDGGADVIHGHSSHHPKAIEVYRGKAILYGCGDFINDYEGIGGQERFRPDLVLMYFADIIPATGGLAALNMIPMQMKRFRLNSVREQDARWLCRALDRESGEYGGRVTFQPEGRLQVNW